MPSPPWRLLPYAALLTGSLALFAAPSPARAAETGPIKIGVISEQSAIVGQAILQGAQLAADDINAKGGVNGRKIEIISYDDHSSASDAVRAFQRAVQQDHVSAVVTTFISEVALAIEPWSARLHMPTITPAAASNLITKQVHDKYDAVQVHVRGLVPLADPRPGGVRRLARHLRRRAAHEDRGGDERGRRLDRAAR